MASVQVAADSIELLPTLSIALAGDEEDSKLRLQQVLNGVGCELNGIPQSEADVLISAHERAGAEVFSNIRAHSQSNPDGLVIMVLGQTSVTDVRRALQAGAHAVVPESQIESALIPSLRAALAGQIVMPKRARNGGAPRVLTTREKQILGLVVMGMTNAEIAAKLFLAESTVKSHLSSAFSKLGVSSRSEAATVILDPETGSGLGILTIPTK
jgi:DNA-binding NarL/FixJ family response regulator